MLDKTDTPRPEGNEAADRARRVGARLRTLRKARKISLVELAELSGLSLGLLSGMERGLRAPTLRSLNALAGVFGLPIGWFYDLDEGAHRGEVVLRSGMGRSFTWADGIEKELLNPDLGGTLEMLIVTIAPHGTSGPKAYVHEGEEAGYILEGQMELWVDGQRYILNPGDSFTFDSQRAHRFGNPGDTPAKLLWVLTPPLYQGRETERA